MKQAESGVVKYMIMIGIALVVLVVVFGGGYTWARDTAIPFMKNLPIIGWGNEQPIEGVEIMRYRLDKGDVQYYTGVKYHGFSGDFEIEGKVWNQDILESSFEKYWYEGKRDDSLKEIRGFISPVEARKSFYEDEDFYEIQEEIGQSDIEEFDRQIKQFDDKVVQLEEQIEDYAPKLDRDIRYYDLIEPYKLRIIFGWIPGTKSWQATLYVSKGEVATDIWGEKFPADSIPVSVQNDNVDFGLSLGIPKEARNYGKGLVQTAKDEIKKLEDEKEKAFQEGFEIGRQKQVRQTSLKQEGFYALVDGLVENYGSEEKYIYHDEVKSRYCVAYFYINNNNNWVKVRCGDSLDNTGQNLEKPWVQLWKGPVKDFLRGYKRTSEYPWTEILKKAQEKLEYRFSNWEAPRGGYDRGEVRVFLVSESSDNNLLYGEFVFDIENNLKLRRLKSGKTELDRGFDKISFDSWNKKDYNFLTNSQYVLSRGVKWRDSVLGNTIELSYKRNGKVETGCFEVEKNNEDLVVRMDKEVKCVVAGVTCGGLGGSWSSDCGMTLEDVTIQVTDDNDKKTYPGYRCCIPPQIK